MLRAAIAAGTPLGAQVKQTLAAGELVADGTIIDLVRRRIAQDDCRNGFLFDGFPRTLAQAQALLDADIAIDHVIEIRVPDGIVVERISGRRIHPQSGRTYHIRHDPPQSPGIDDCSGEPLIQREDDREETVRDRLRIYREQTEPLSDFYRRQSASGTVRHSIIDGSASVERIQFGICSAIGREDAADSAKTL